MAASFNRGQFVRVKDLNNGKLYIAKGREVLLSPKV